jgi:hypothetical protein
LPGLTVTRSTRALRLAAAALVVAVAGLVLPAGPATATTCSSADGVSVVVDFHELGGGVRTACVAGGGGQRASSLFPAAGFSLSYVQRQPGFVCRVDGAPSTDPCVNTPPADAYWGLWWSDGRSGSWTYATTSATGLTIPEGGYVAFSWNGSSSRATPGVGASPHAAEPTPTAGPTKSPSSKPTPAGHTGTAGQPTKSPGGVDGEMLPEDTASSATPSAADPATPARKSGAKSGKQGGTKGGTKPAAPPERSATPSPSVAPTDGATDDLAPATADPDPADPDGGLPTWVAPAVIALLFAGAGGAALVRRRRGSAAP